jgi:probable F420-dependent oxidoreductase
VRLGVVFPSYEIGNDPALIKEWAQTAEGLGYTHIAVYDHVLGADAKRPGGWAGRYSNDQAFHEPFVLMGFLAAVTTAIEFVTGILVLPQRQTALVAKQAAEVAVLAQGRLRLGVGIGWNDVEYEALGMNFHDRGRRVEEQIGLLRQLWENDTIDYSGQYHRVPGAGLNPRPASRIPIWLGGNHDLTIERAARLCDGWFQPMFLPTSPEAPMKRARLDAALRAAGRNPADFGVEGWVNYDPATRDRWREQIDAWGTWGASHVSMRAFDRGLPRPQDHLAALREYMEAVRR